MDRHTGGMHPSRAISPRFELRHRSRRADSSTEEIIRFVREFQMEQQPPHLRLHRKAPLPGIGEHPSHRINDYGFEDGRNDNLDSDNDEDLLDDEVAAIGANVGSFRHQAARIRSYSDARQPNRNSFNSKSQHFYSSKSYHIPGKHTENRSFKGLRLGQMNSMLQQLPPIERTDLPERPSAPSPGITPPPPGEELDSAGEPMDFIDIS